MLLPTGEAGPAPAPSSRLPDWLEAGAGAAARAGVRAHPRFASAMLACAGSTVEAFDNHPLLNRVLNDRGRAVFGFLLLHLDAAPDGLGITAARMASLCREEDVCSRGRAKALLALMRWGGFLATAEGKGDRRERPLVPTERMWTSFRTRWRGHFTAMRPLGGVAEAALARLDDPGFCRTLAFTFGVTFRAGFRVLDHAPVLWPFADRDGGMMILFALFVAGRTNAPPPTVAELARRFQLSRAHVLLILRGAMAAKLVRRTGENERESAGFFILPAGEEALADFFAALFALLDCSAGRALADPLPQEGGDAPFSAPDRGGT